MDTYKRWMAILLITFVLNGNQFHAQDCGTPTCETEVIPNCKCGYDDGVFTVNQSISLDGCFSDWEVILNDPDNVVCDEVGAGDRDHPVQYTGRDLRHFAMTWDATNVYTFTKREASSIPIQNFIYYADVDNDGLMETGEPIIAVAWDGSDRKIEGFYGTYASSTPEGDPMEDKNGFADGYALPGTIEGLAPPEQPDFSLCSASDNGLTMEWSVSWAQLGIAPETPFRFRISNTNIRPESGPFPAQIDDNMGGCGGCAGTTQFSSVTFSPDQKTSTASSQTVYLAHALTNDGNGVDVFDLSSIPSGDFTPTTIAYYQDKGIVGTFEKDVDILLTDTDSDTIPDTGNLAGKTSMNLFVAIAIPASPTSGTGTITTTATSNFISACGSGTAASSSVADSVSIGPADDTTEDVTISEENPAADDSAAVIAEDATAAEGSSVSNGSAAITVEDVTAAEGDDLVFTVKLDKEVPNAFGVTASFVDISATGSVDFNPSPVTLNFSGTAGETQEFMVTTTDDGITELEETFTVKLEVTDGSVIDTDTATGTINDNDSTALRVEDITQTEGGDLVFTVILSNPIASDFDVNVSFDDISTIGGEDFDNTAVVLNFSGNSDKTKQFTVTTTNDTILEGSETFTVKLDATSELVDDSDTATGTINDNDTAAITVENTTETEGTGLQFTVTLNNPVQGGFKVDATLTDVTATGGNDPLEAPDDYDKVVAQLTFSGTENETQQFTVATFDDSIVEGGETFRVNLDADNPSITDTDTAKGTINDNDTAEITIEDVTETEGTDLQFTISLDATVQNGFNVDVTLTDATATGGAPPKDYNNVVERLKFVGEANETQQFSITSFDDSVLEGAETFTISLNADHTSVTDTDTATGTINDNDTAEITVEDVAEIEGNDLQFTVTLDSAIQGGFGVDVSLEDVSATGGEAPLAYPADYDKTVAKLTFMGTEGETQQFSIASFDDSVLESAETFTISLNADHTSVTATDTATGTINDNDTAEISVEDIAVSEGKELLFTVTLDNAVANAFSVDVILNDITAKGGAAPLVSPVDFDNTGTTLNFAGTASETQQFTIATQDDEVMEDIENFSVSLNASEASIIDKNTAIGTITDNDMASIMVEDVRATEGDDLLFTVSLDNDVASPFVVDITLDDITASGGAAPLVSPADFDNTVASLNFEGTASETQQFTVTTVSDEVLEGTELFSVKLNARNAIVNDTDMAIGTIMDKNTASVTVEDVRATEGKELSFTVTLDQAVANAFTVDVSLSDLTATGGTTPLEMPEDFDNVVATLNFAGTAAESQQFTVATLDDTVLEGSETFRVSLNASNPAVDDTDTAIGTIDNIDTNKIVVKDVTETE